MSVDVPQAAPAQPGRGAAPDAEPARAAAFREQIEQMKIPAPNAGRDKLLARLGGLLAALGVALGVIAYFMSHNTDNSLSQNDAQVLAMVGLSCAIVGSAVFVRYSLANFLRLWLVRLIHEQRRD
jgi:hypothetical protein